MEPQDPDDPTHEEASDTKIEFDFGWYAHPILIDGTYPQVMRDKVLIIEDDNMTPIAPMKNWQIDAKSEAQGFTESRLPTFTDEESAEIAGSFDFLGVNHYTTNLVYPEDGDLSVVSFFEDADVVNYSDESWYPWVHAEFWQRLFLRQVVANASLILDKNNTLAISIHETKCAFKRYISIVFTSYNITLFTQIRILLVESRSIWDQVWQWRKKSITN